MKTINNLKSKLPTDALLSLQEGHAIKGGLRYETSDPSKFTNKLMSLQMQGEDCSWGIHNGKYCIEW